MAPQRSVILMLYIVTLCIFAKAQNASPKTQNFSSEDVSFSYPANWKVVDKSTLQMQQFNLVPDIGNILIMIVAYRPKVSSSDEFEQLKVQVTQPRVDKILKGFSDVKQTETCIEIEGSKVPGQRISGLYGKEQTTSDIFSFVINKKFINLIYLKENRESTKSDSAWENTVKTLQIKTKNADKNELLIDEDNGVVNGRAIKLPRPIFPSGIGSNEGSRLNFKITQPVKVRVIIDESGNVISAKAVSGNPSLQPAAIQAAKQAMFAPTYLCGDVVKKSGIILYNFSHN